MCSLYYYSMYCVFVGLTFDNNDEAYDFQVCKWMIANKVTDIQPHPPTVIFL